MDARSAGERVRILLVDDLVLLRQSLRCMLERRPGFIVVGEAGDGATAVQLARELAPDVIVMDIRMPKLDGLSALRQIRLAVPGCNVVMLTVSEEAGDLFEAVKAGARGYVLKSADAGDLIRAVECVSDGGAVVSPLMALKLLREFASAGADHAEHSNDDVTALTQREKEILELLRHGLSNKEIASSLMITEGTVKSHLRNVMEKLHVRNRVQAATYALTVKLDAKSKPKRA